jgi:CheY-like chemotaxis protein
VFNREEILAVLVVEDEWLLRAAIAANLRDCGCRVLEAPDGETAVSLIEDGARVHAVVTDIHLAGRMDGWDVGEALRALLPGVAVIYASGAYTEPRRPVRGARELDKPYSHVEVLDACRSLCNGAIASAPRPRTG